MMKSRAISRFLGLEVYEHGFAAEKVPKTLLDGLVTLLMGFADCGSSYFLLLQIDKDFKPIIKLLETQPDQAIKVHTKNDPNQVMRIKNIDISQMQLLEDELNLNLLDRDKLSSLLPDAHDCRHISEDNLLSELSLQSTMQITGSPRSVFSSVVDEVFQLEKGASAASSLQNSSFNVGSNYMNMSNVKAGTTSKWEGVTHNIGKISGAMYTGSSNLSSNLKGPGFSNSFCSLSSGLGRGTNVKELTASKSDQDLASLRSPHTVEVGSNSSVDEEHVKLLNDAPKDALRSSRLQSPSWQPGSRASALDSKSNVLRSSAVGALAGSLRVAGSSSLPSTPVSYIGGDTAICHGSSPDIPKNDRNPRKRTASDMLNLIPSLHNIAKAGSPKRSRRSGPDRLLQPLSEVLAPLELVSKREGYNCGNLLAEANKGNVPSSIYISVLLNVVRHCSICIKHARLTSQMEALDIPYVEEVGLRSASSNIWFRLPFAMIPKVAEILKD